MLVGMPVPDPAALEALRAASGLSIDLEGRFCHRGAPVTHARTLAVLWGSLHRRADGQYAVQVGREVGYVRVEGAPYSVRGVTFEEGWPHLHLGDGTAERLDPATLAVGPDGVLCCLVKGDHRARFARRRAGRSRAGSGGGCGRPRPLRPPPRRAGLAGELRRRAGRGREGGWMSFMTWWTLGIVLGLTLLTVLFTGPGMWSEKWGWSWLERREKRRPPAPGEAPDQGSPIGAGEPSSRPDATSAVGASSHPDPQPPEGAPPPGEGAPGQGDGPPRR